MSKAELSENEIKAEIMHRLLRKGCWGKVYLPVDTLVKWVGSMIKRNGKRVRKIWARESDRLISSSLILFSKELFGVFFGVWALLWLEICIV